KSVREGAARRARPRGPGTPPGRPQALRSTASAVLERRLSLLHEGGHALLLVLGREQRVEDPPLEQDPLGQGGLVGAIDRLLEDHDRRQRVGGDYRGSFQRLVEQALG